MYLTPQKLKELVLDAQRQGRMTADLAQAVARIAAGVWAGGGKGRCAGVEEEDFCQHVVGHMLTRFHFIDPEREVFNYLTTTCLQLLQRMSISNTRRKEMFKKFADEVIREQLWELRIQPDRRHQHETYKQQGHSRGGW